MSVEKSTAGVRGDSRVQYGAERGTVWAQVEAWKYPRRICGGGEGRRDGGGEEEGGRRKEEKEEEPEEGGASTKQTHGSQE